MNEITDNKTCQQHLAEFFKKYPNPTLQRETKGMLRSLLDFRIPMPGSSGGWAGGMVYAAANRYRQSCGIPGLLNNQCKAFFGVSMSTIYKRSWMVRKMLDFKNGRFCMF